MTRALTALVALTLLVLPSAATAQTNAPPGNSAIDEYLETVPGATGNQIPGKSGAGGAALTAAERARLERFGPDGKVLADAVDRTTSVGPKTDSSTAFPAAEGRSPLSEALDAAVGRDGGGGMGVLLPAILLAALLGVIALLLARRRSAGR